MITSTRTRTIVGKGITPLQFFNRPRPRSLKGGKEKSEHEDEDDCGEGDHPFAQWLARIPLVKSWNG
jgi:hypothetical protein